MKSVVQQSTCCNRVSGSATDRLAERVAAYLDATPHAIFIVAGLYLLALCPFYLIGERERSAERLANWAYGYLVLGVGTALLPMISIPQRLRDWVQGRPLAATTALVLLLGLTGLALEAGEPELSGLPGLERGNAQFLVDRLKSITSKNDVVLFTPSAFPLRRYYYGPAWAVKTPAGLTEAQMTGWLQERLKGRRKAVLVARAYQAFDPNGYLPFFLEVNGRLVSASKEPVRINAYELSRALTPVSMAPALADFGPVTVTGAYLEPQAESQGALAMALRWRQVQQTNKQLKVTLRLYDDKQHLIAAADDFLVDRQGRRTDQWKPDEEVTDYHLLPIPLGTPPLSYTVALGVYSKDDPGGLSLLVKKVPQDKRFVLGTVKVERAGTGDQDPYLTAGLDKLTPSQVALAPGLKLEAYGVDREDVSAGQGVSLTLRWRSVGKRLPDYKVRLSMVQGERLVAEEVGAPAGGAYPTTRWIENEVVTDRWDLHVSPNAEDGMAILQAGVEGFPALSLTTLKIRRVGVSYAMPVISHPMSVTFGDFAELLGYDLEGIPASPKDKLRLTLFWRASNERPIPTSYKVFTQVLNAQGLLIGQHDGVPVSGERPTTGWVKGEILTDRHELEFQDTGYRGEGTVIVGLYDPETMQRVRVTPTNLDHVPLPTKITIETKITVKPVP